MGFTVGSMAQAGVGAAMALGSAQAQNLGLGQQGAQALGVSNLADKDQGKLVSDLMANRSQTRGVNKDELMTIGRA
ncbi:MAG: hypothetical protein JRJ59_09960, partial [Deltaproteobacteria bacterium]|nr:hypothetical protein [Deltaproteobacteria bacterium]